MKEEKENKLTILEAIERIESDIDPNEDEDELAHDRLLEAWQYLLDTGVVWNLQGSYQRHVIYLLECGYLDSPPTNLKTGTYA